MVEIMERQNNASVDLLRPLLAMISDTNTLLGGQRFYIFESQLRLEAYDRTNFENQFISIISVSNTTQASTQIHCTSLIVESVFQNVHSFCAEK